MKCSQLNHVLAQLAAAKSELSQYPPQEVDWYSRATETCKELVPFLVDHALGLREYVDGVMNSPFVLRRDLSRISEIAAKSSMSRSKKFKTLWKSVETSAEFEKLLLTHVGGTTVSKLIEKYLIAESGNYALLSNGASDYPDLYSSVKDYSKLPAFRRGKNQVYGAAVKGKKQRPVRVPDGLEIKTCSKAFAVDCHHAHTGLHLVLLFNKTGSEFKTFDIQIAFLRKELYRITNPSSPTTTLKASFNGSHFVSLLSEDGKPSKT